MCQYYETKPTFTTVAPPKTTERETKNKISSQEKMVTTAVRNKPNKNHQEKQEGSFEPENKKREERKNRRAKRPKMKARWIGEGDGKKLVGRNKAGTKKGEGQERENQRNKTTILTQKLGR